MKAKEARITEQTVSRDSSENPAQIAARVIGISKRFGKTSVLEDITFDVAEGEALVLLGASGSGKTTILRIIAGLEQPYTGKVILHGRDVTELPARERGVGVIFQSYALFPKMTVERNIAYGLRIRRRRRKEIRETVNELLSLVRLEEHRKKHPSQLSGGQQQRVAIARTLAYKPEVLLFDEPFVELDAHTRIYLRREIHALLIKVNGPSIFITHDQQEALELGDRIAVINAGHIEQIGTPAEIYNHPATEYVATFLGTANILSGVIRGGGIAIGNAYIPFEPKQFVEGQPVKLIFRPEDVVLSRAGTIGPRSVRLSTGVVNEISFSGAYESLKVTLHLSNAVSYEGENLFNSSTPESEGTPKPIIVTRLKSEAHAVKLRQRDRVIAGLTSFTVLKDNPAGTDPKTATTGSLTI